MTINMDRGDSVLVRVAKTMQLKSRYLEVVGAIQQIDQGYPVLMSVGGIHVRLSDHGRENIVTEIRNDLSFHQDELDRELLDRGVDMKEGERR